MLACELSEVQEVWELPCSESGRHDSGSFLRGCLSCSIELLPCCFAIGCANMRRNLCD